MKTFLTIAALLTALSLPLGAQAVFGLGGDKCTDQAVALVKTHGPKATALFGKLEAGGSITASDLQVSDKELAQLKDYVSSGCAKDHLEKALKAGGAAKGLF